MGLFSYDQAYLNFGKIQKGTPRLSIAFERGENKIADSGISKIQVSVLSRWNDILVLWIIFQGVISGSF